VYVATFKVSIAASDRQIHDQIATLSVYKNNKRNKITTKIVPYRAIPTIFKHIPVTFLNGLLKKHTLGNTGRH
jgi:hypothetical protein